MEVDRPNGGLGLRAECAAGAHAVADDLPGVYAGLHARGIVWVVGGWFARAREAGFALPITKFNLKT